MMPDLKIGSPQKIEVHQLTLGLSQHKIDLAPHLVSEPYDNRLVLSGQIPHSILAAIPALLPPNLSSYYL